MLKRIIIGNFKGIGEKVEIDLRPITLLFGANSVGKSSILHAFHLAHELFHGSSLNVTRTKLSDGYVNLGGFGNYVHNRDTSRAVTIGFENQWDPGVDKDASNYIFEENYAAQSMVQFRHRIYSYRVEFSIKLGEFNRPFVSSASIEVNNEPTAQISVGIGSMETFRFNTGHGLFLAIRNEIERAYPRQWIVGGNAWTRHLFQKAFGKDSVDESGWGTIPAVFVDLREGDILEGPYSTDKPRTDVISEAMALVNIMTMEPIRHLKDVLSEVRHIGPIRSIPDRRTFGHEDHHDHTTEAKWFDGTAAWTLGTHSQQVKNIFSSSFSLQDINVFLSHAQLLDTNYRLMIRSWRYFPDNRAEVEAFREGASFHDDNEKVPIPSLESFVGLLPVNQRAISKLSAKEMRAKLKAMLERVNAMPQRRQLILHDTMRGIDLTPQDVGTGISQAVPVLVAFMDSGHLHTMLIEQPELHLHPKAQTAIADAAILGCRENASHPLHGPRVIETHSEHMLLRLLKRIRQTCSGKLADNSPLRLQPEDISVIYVDRPEGGEEGTGARVRRLRVDETGEFIDRWPNGFFDERAKEVLE